MNQTDYTLQDNFRSFPINLKEEENLFQPFYEQPQKGLMQTTLTQSLEGKWGGEERSEEETNHCLLQGSLEFQEGTKLVSNLHKNGAWEDCFTLQRQNNQTISYFGEECIWDLSLASNLEEGEIAFLNKKEEKDKKKILTENNSIMDDPQILSFPSSYEEENRMDFSFSDFLQRLDEKQSENQINFANSQNYEPNPTLDELKSNLIERPSSQERKRVYSQTIKINEREGEGEEKEEEKEKEKEKGGKGGKETGSPVGLGKQKSKKPKHHGRKKTTISHHKKAKKCPKGVVSVHGIDWQRKTFKIEKFGTKVTIFKKKRKTRSQRLYTSNYGKKVLEKWFLKHLNDEGGPYPKKRQRKILAIKAEIPQLQVQRWFGQRRRAERIRWENGEAPKPHWIEED
ncbi:hypothetical protein M0812_25901 [Anaeramoeba flamelloides]|uniref:Homeobox domain-containing protein n=1 Tax=Anaeramoeba flamelloides TaxID=1746091 RepID=A0AAV7YHY3_9EUKA|nr:hypothetical protein M0812_25901 [Anaeramoeba flamelloides]